MREAPEGQVYACPHCFVKVLNSCYHDGWNYESRLMPIKEYQTKRIEYLKWERDDLLDAILDSTREHDRLVDEVAKLYRDDPR